MKYAPLLTIGEPSYVICAIGKYSYIIRTIGKPSYVIRAPPLNHRRT